MAAHIIFRRDDPGYFPEYDRYIKLVEYGRNCGWDHAQITHEGPFAVADPGITFILMRADKELRRHPVGLGQESAAREIDTWLCQERYAADYL